MTTDVCDDLLLHVVQYDMCSLPGSGACYWSPSLVVPQLPRCAPALLSSKEHPA